MVVAGSGLLPEYITLQKILEVTEKAAYWLGTLGYEQQPSREFPRLLFKFLDALAWTLERSAARKYKKAQTRNSPQEIVLSSQKPGKRTPKGTRMLSWHLPILRVIKKQQ